MRVRWTRDGATWRLAFRLDREDAIVGTVTDGQPVALATNTCEVRLPREIPEPHPDLLATAAWTVIAPWTRRRLRFDRPISPELAMAFAGGWGVEAGPTAGTPRRGGRLAISYSGGADSVAVAELLEEAPFIHFQRVSHPRIPNRWTHYRADVLADLAAETGRDLTVVRSDLEFTLAEPRPGYPEHHAVAAGALLLADEMDLGGLAFGYELGSRWLGGDRYILRYTPDNPMWAPHGAWGRLFEAAGLSIVLPMGGVSEAVTMRIALDSKLADQVRWCLRGSRGAPCGTCGKCLYKELIQAAVERRPLDTTVTAKRPVARKWQEPPPYGGQEMIEYGCAWVPGIQKGPFAKAAEHLRATPKSVGWLERCYRPAVAEIPARWRKRIEDYMALEVGFMNEDEARKVETWGQTCGTAAGAASGTAAGTAAGTAGEAADG
ncbi:hypothetical protein SAMN05421505_12260 [Sinosporangium album]|uniref:7-cyano-7-deazaguanine synthase (Queuosine biosynthesis) n=1 Tax=Sinosporangium album TaxID=504805 RepID=A0A1G8F5H6_9ACTN|nr:DUF6395 domain-containing protein [Sinosporangium album]SDH77374.1 hypothetical protein SAMN05421505_12260 [Sinosporangium album]